MKRIRQLRSDKGYVIALTGLLLVPLMAFTGLAVDLGSWQARGRILQQATDAASLAGVVQLPDVAAAEDVAIDTLQRNGIVDADGYRVIADGTTCEDGSDTDQIVVCLSYPTDRRMRVTVNELAIDQYFTSLFVDDVSVARGATSEFIEPVPMGSPSAILGNDPEAGWAKDFRLNTAGFNQNKSNGDKRTAGNCSGSSAGCTSGNTDFNEDGYFFGVKVDQDHTVTEPLSIEVFDPALVQQGDKCNNNDPNRNESRTLFNQYTGDRRTGDPAGGFNTLWRYGQANTWNSGSGHRAEFPFNNAQYQFLDNRAEMACTGDHRISGANNADALVSTTYIVRAPDETPFDPTDNDPVCTITFDPYTPGGSVFQLLDTGGTYDGIANVDPRGRENVAFYKHYRRWFPICEVPSSQVQSAQATMKALGEDAEWVVQVRTNADLTTTPVVTTANSAASFGTVLNAEPSPTNDRGHTRYGMRAAWGAAPTVNSPTDNPVRDTGTALGDTDADFIASPVFAGLSVSASGNLPIYVNKDDAEATFYLARLLEANAGRTLRLTFWDMADVGNSAANVDILFPSTVDSSDVPGGCDTYRFTDAAGMHSPPGVTTGVNNEVIDGVDTTYCYINNITQANYNGRDVVVDIPIPADYTCDESDQLACWFKVRITFTSANASANDTTTWSASMNGDPVRLVN
jgi:hypothetical protein